MKVFRSINSNLQVVWGCSAAPRDAVPMYSPDAQGVYPLCHGIVPGQPVNMFTAKEGVPVDTQDGRRWVMCGRL